MGELRGVVSLGAGRMGRGIAHTFAYAGYPVVLVDLKKRDSREYQRVADETLNEIRQSLSACANAGLFEACHIDVIAQRISVVPAQSVRATEACATAGFVFECVPEVMDAKREAFAWLASCVGDDTLVASTTSTFLVDSVSQLLASNLQARFLNAHWLNPAYLIPLVEVSPGESTASSTTDRVLALLRSIGKEPVVCAASPGFIVPRIQALAMNEAARMVEEGVASAQDIDRAMRYGFGFRYAMMGMVEFIDWGGGDILYYASHYLKDALNAERFTPPASIEQNMHAGNLGLKTGKGFYDYSDIDEQAYRAAALKRFVDMLQFMEAAQAPVLD